MSETKTVWHKYPEELPPGDGHYLITAHDYGDTIEHPWIDIDFFDKDAGRFLLLDWMALIRAGVSRPGQSCQSLPTRNPFGRRL